MGFLVLFEGRLGALYPVAAHVTVVVLGSGGTVLALDVLHQQVAAREGQPAALGLADVRFDAWKLRVIRFFLDFSINKISNKMVL